MSKKRRTQVPQFGSSRPASGHPAAPTPKGVKPPPTPVQRAKPQTTSAKSGQRGK